MMAKLKTPIMRVTTFPVFESPGSSYMEVSAIAPINIGEMASTAFQRMHTHLFGGDCFRGTSTSWGEYDWHWPYIMI